MPSSLPLFTRTKEAYLSLGTDIILSSTNRLQGSCRSGHAIPLVQGLACLINGKSLIGRAHSFHELKMSFSPRFRTLWRSTCSNGRCALVKRLLTLARALRWWLTQWLSGGVSEPPPFFLPCHGFRGSSYISLSGDPSTTKLGGCLSLCHLPCFLIRFLLVPDLDFPDD